MADIGWPLKPAKASKEPVILRIGFPTTPIPFSQYINIRLPPSVRVRLRSRGIRTFKPFIIASSFPLITQWYPAPCMFKRSTAVTPLLHLWYPTPRGPSRIRIRCRMFPTQKGYQSFVILIIFPTCSTQISQNPFSNQSSSSYSGIDHPPLPVTSHADRNSVRRWQASRHASSLIGAIDSKWLPTRPHREEPVECQPFQCQTPISELRHR